MTLLAELADENLQDEQDDDDGNHVVPEQDTEYQQFKVIHDVDHFLTPEGPQCERESERDNDENQILVPCAENKSEPADDAECHNCDGEFCFASVRGRDAHRIYPFIFGAFPLDVFILSHMKSKKQVPVFLIYDRDTLALMNWWIKFLRYGYGGKKIADTRKARFLGWEPGLPLWLLAKLVEQYF